VTGFRRRGTGLAAAALVALGGCSAQGTSTGSAAPATTPSVPTPDHVVVVVFENKDPQSVIGAPDAPYLTALSETGTYFTDAHAVTHPSQPNYIALFSGSTHGVTDDTCPQELRGDNLASQLLAAGKSFAGYSEDLPSTGAEDCAADGYRRKHAPWADFADLPASVNQPYSAMPADYADLPTVSFVVPDLCDDMHDCSVATGDEWAKAQLAPYVTWARTHDSLLVVTFDESETRESDGNRIATFFVGPMVRPGVSSTEIDHYSVLRTVEEMYGLPAIGSAADRAPVTGIWTAPGG
jgi:acid phosphatase